MSCTRMRRRNLTHDEVNSFWGGFVTLPPQPEKPTPEVYLEAEGMLALCKRLETYTIDLAYTVVNTLRDRPTEFSLGEWTDLGFFFRTSEKSLDTLRKECARIHQEVGRALCLAITKRCMADPSLEINVSGKYATASPDVQKTPTLPPKGTAEYRELLSMLGASEEVTQQDILRPHWKNLQEFVTELARKGDSSLDHLIGSKLSPKVVYRKKSRKRN